MNTTTISICGYDEKTGNCTQNPCCRANEGLVKLLKHGASIARDRGINLDYAKVADEAAEAILKLEAHIANFKSDFVNNVNAFQKARNMFVNKSDKTKPITALDITPEMAEEVESIIGMGASAWDMVNHKELIAAAVTVFLKSKNMSINEEDKNGPEYKLAQFGATTAMVNMSGAIPSWEAVNRAAIRTGVMEVTVGEGECVYAPGVEGAIRKLLAKKPWENNRKNSDTANG